MTWALQWQTTVSYNFNGTYYDSQATKTNDRCEHNGTISGTSIKVTCPCSNTSGQNVTFEKVTIGASTSNDDFNATPSKILFGGNESVTLTGGSGNTVVSDALSFTFTSGTRYLIAILKGIYYLARYVSGGVPGNDYYEKYTNTDESSTVTVSGYDAYELVQDVSKIEVARNVYKNSITSATKPSAVLFDGVVGTEQASYNDLWAGADDCWWYDDPNDYIYIRSVADPSGRSIQLVRNFAGLSACAVTVANPKLLRYSNFSGTSGASISIPDADLSRYANFAGTSAAGISVPNILLNRYANFAGASSLAIAIPDFDLLRYANFAGTSALAIVIPDFNIDPGTAVYKDFAGTSTCIIAIPDIDLLRYANFVGASVMEITIPDIELQLFYGTSGASKKYTGYRIFTVMN